MSQVLLFLLPGLDGTGDLFAPLLEVMPGNFPARVVRYPVDRMLSYDALLGVIEDQLKSEQGVVLVAESFSGPLALRYAAMSAGRVRAVVLCASFIRPPVPRWLRWFAKAFWFRLRPPGLLLRQWLLGRGAPNELVRQVRKAIGRVQPAVLAARLREVFDVECSDALRQCRAPILYLAPARDAEVRRSSVEAIRAIRPDVRVRSVEGPHLLLQSEPRRAWAEIERFLEETGAMRAVI